jgi:hypothetical protein
LTFEAKGVLDQKAEDYRLKELHLLNAPEKLKLEEFMFNLRILVDHERVKALAVAKGRNQNAQGSEEQEVAQEAFGAAREVVAYSRSNDASSKSVDTL